MGSFKRNPVANKSTDGDDALDFLFLDLYYYLTNHNKDTNTIFEKIYDVIKEHVEKNEKFLEDFSEYLYYSVNEDHCIVVDWEKINLEIFEKFEKKIFDKDFDKTKLKNTWNNIINQLKTLNHLFEYVLYKREFVSDSIKKRNNYYLFSKYLQTITVPLKKLSEQTNNLVSEEKNISDEALLETKKKNIIFNYFKLLKNLERIIFLYFKGRYQHENGFTNGLEVFLSFQENLFEEIKRLLRVVCDSSKEDISSRDENHKKILVHEKLDNIFKIYYKIYLLKKINSFINKTMTKNCLELGFKILDNPIKKILEKDENYNKLINDSFQSILDGFLSNIKFDDLSTWLLNLEEKNYNKEFIKDFIENEQREKLVIKLFLEQQKEKFFNFDKIDKYDFPRKVDCFFDMLIIIQRKLIEKKLSTFLSLGNYGLKKDFLRGFFKIILQKNYGEVKVDSLPENLKNFFSSSCSESEEKSSLSVLSNQINIIKHLKDKTESYLEHFLTNEIDDIFYENLILYCMASINVFLAENKE